MNGSRTNEEFHDAASLAGLGLPGSGMSTLEAVDERAGRLVVEERSGGSGVKGTAPTVSLSSSTAEAVGDPVRQAAPRVKREEAQRSEARFPQGASWRALLRDSYAAAVARTGGCLLLADVSGLIIPVLGTVLIMPLGGASVETSDCLICLMAVNLLTYLAFAGLYPGVGISPVLEFRQITVATTLAFSSYWIAALTLGRAPEGWPALALAWALAIVSVTVARHVARRFLGRYSWWGFRVAVAGEATAAREAWETLESYPAHGLRPVAMLNRPTLQKGQGAVGPDIHYVLFAVSESSLREQASSINGLCQRFSRIIVLLPDTAHLFGGLSVRASQCGLAVGVEVRNRLLSRPSRIAKRSFDLSLAISAMPALLLVTVAAALLNRRAPGAPLFFGHERIGQNGRPFKVWKLRTMGVNAEALLREHLEKHPDLRDEWERNHKLLEDPRVTKIGRWLRLTSLDEVPQIWNVIRGEMSIVGPRPIVRGEIQKYGACFDLYTSVRPGLTGLWQVSGRNNTTYPQRVGLDSFYSRNWSIWLDLYIIMRTFRAVMTGDGAR